MDKKTGVTDAREIAQATGENVTVALSDGRAFSGTVMRVETEADKSGQSWPVRVEALIRIDPIS